MAATTAPIPRTAPARTSPPGGASTTSSRPRARATRPGSGRRTQGPPPAAPWNHWTHYSPGDAYVDWVGIDGYNWGTTQSWSSWSSFASLVRPVYSDYAGRKPIMIAETASAE